MMEAGNARPGREIEGAAPEAGAPSAGDLHVSQALFGRLAGAVGKGGADTLDGRQRASG